jgi:hypothetical protein
VTNANGCAGADTVVVTNCHPVNPGCAPVAAFTVVHSSSSYAATFVNHSTGGIKHYFWNYGDNTTSTDSGSSVHTYSTSNIYTVTLIVCGDTCGCDTITHTVNVNVGINEIAGISALSLYPNPAATSCNLSILSEERMAVTMTLTDMVGAVVGNDKWELAAGATMHSLDLSNMAAGMYTITLKTESGNLTRKLNIIK